MAQPVNWTPLKTMGKFESLDEGGRSLREEKFATHGLMMHCSPYRCAIIGVGNVIVMGLWWQRRG